MEKENKMTGVNMNKKKRRQSSAEKRVNIYEKFGGLKVICNCIRHLIL